MSFRDLALRTSKIVTDNSPAILTALGVLGTITTAYLTGKATFQAAEMIFLEQDQLRRKAEEHGIYDEPQIPAKERVEMVWRLYIPAAATGLVTLAAIICANRIGTRRAAAMAAAYAISERAFEDYKDKVVEKIGATKEQTIRDEIAQERVTANPPPEALVAYGASVLCKDEFTGRYFISDMETIKHAENEVNRRILGGDMYVSLTDFYEEIGLERTSMSDDVGWNIDKLLNISFTTALTPFGKPCLVMDFHTMPVRHFTHFH
jgi:hypothetical protein